MENAAELLRLFVQALALFATSLDRWFQIPWPSVLAVFFVPVVVALNVGIWWLRGMVFPISCGYMTVHEKSRCRRKTLGEWHKCWYHRQRRLQRTDQHLVPRAVVTREGRIEIYRTDGQGGAAGRPATAHQHHRDG